MLVFPSSPHRIIDILVPVIPGLIEGGKILPKFFQVLVACFKRFDQVNLFHKIGYSSG